MKATSGHFILDEGVEFRDLSKVFPEVLTMFLEDTDQLPDDEDVLQMFIYLNQQALERNEKPEGYNRKGRMRLVFPIGSKQFYIKANISNADVVKLSEKISKALSKAGVKHSLQFNLLSSDTE